MSSEDAPTTQTPVRSGLRLLPRGESLVAWSGLGAAIVTFVALGASTLWFMHVHREQLRRERLERAGVVSRVLRTSVEQRLGDGELSSLRAMVAGVPPAGGVSQVRVTAQVPSRDGTPREYIVADSGMSSKYDALPEGWERAANAPPVSPGGVTLQDPGVSEIRVPVAIKGGGTVTLIVRAEEDYPLIAGWEGLAGAGAATALSMSALWGMYRGARKRLRTAGAVHDALRWMERGESSAAALSVAPEFGGEARAWNRLVHEAEQYRRRQSGELAHSSAGVRRGGDGTLSSVCDGLWQGLIMVDEGGAVRYVNGAACVFAGRRRDELEGRSLNESGIDERVCAMVMKTATGAQRTRGSVEVRRADGGDGGGSLLRYSVRPMRAGERAGALVVIEDITQQRVADEARNAFVASATHELRTPLTNIRLYVDQLVEEPDLDAPRRAQALNVMSQEIRRLERLVGDMLSVSEIEAGQMSLQHGDVRLETVFEELRADFDQQAMQKHVRLSFELPPKWPQMVGDRDKIMLALHNLVGNAIKYTPDGGVINVRVSENAGRLSVEVADTGIGIAEDEAELVFERFYRAKDKRVMTITGTGLGLSIAREVVRLHGGDIGVKSQLDKGTTFTVTLPLAA